MGEIPVDWALKPSGLEAGDRFRLLFFSSTVRNAASTDIAVYNRFVQDRAAAGHAAIQAYASQFRAVACTAAVDAVDNTGTEGTGVPIYWLGGNKAADDYGDFYDGAWDEEASVRDESGTAVTIRANTDDGTVWTGCDGEGREGDDGTGTSIGLGAVTPGIGYLNFVHTLNPLYAAAYQAKANTLPLYGLSPVFAVRPPSREVPVAWTLKPPGLEAGDRFRLLFFSSTVRNAASTDIAVYNRFVQDRAAAGHAAIQAYASQFRAVACTAAVDAVDNTGTEGTGVPIYWLGGNKAADDYGDFYDGAWDEEASVRDESGTAVTIRANTDDGTVWTGCDGEGREGDDGTGTSIGLGAVTPGIGYLNFVHTLNPLYAAAYQAKANTLPLYGLSPVFAVDDAAVSVSTSTLSVVEGSMATYTLVLDAEPTASVTVNITGGGDVSAGPTSLTFSATTWDTAQTVTVTAAEDLDTVNDTQTITHVVADSSAAEYLGLSVDSVAVTVSDNDAAGVSVSTSTLSVIEGGSGTYTVRLAFQPTASVTVNVTGGGDVTVNPTALAYSATTWDTAQTVTVTAAEDLDAVDDTQTVTHAVADGSAAEYRGLSVDSVAVTVTDNDDPAVTVSFEHGAYSVAEGGSVTVKVRLSADPKRTVAVPFTRTNQGGASASDYSGVPGSVRFQSGETERSITFRAAQDAVDDDGESVTLGFGTLPPRVTAGATSEATVAIDNVEPPNRAPRVSARADPDTVAEGGTVTLDGTASDPEGDALTFAWSSDGGGTFTNNSALDTTWTAPQTQADVTVYLTLTARDPDGASASGTVSVVVSPLPRPDAATNLQASVFDDNSVALSWTLPGQPPAVTIANVEVWLRERGVTDYRRLYTHMASAEASAVPGTELAADTEYFFRIRVTTTEGPFVDSAPVRVRTLTEAPAPEDLRATWPTQTSITLSWFSLETAAEYKLEYRKDGEAAWTPIRGDFDHLPSTSDHRAAFGVAAGLECDTPYHFRVSARGSGDTRNDGSRYFSSVFGAYATTSARTGECAQAEKVTNLLVSIEPDCATLTWTPTSGNQDTGYRVVRTTYTGNRSQSSDQELVEARTRVADAHQDCSPTYRTDGAEHVYTVYALDGQGEVIGLARSALHPYGPSRVQEGPRNLRLTQDTQFIRRLAWDAPRDPWLTTAKTARAGSGPQQVVVDPWIDGYRVERREYRKNELGDWYLPEPWVIWSARMTVGASTSGIAATGYFGLGSGAFGALTQPTFSHPVGSGAWTVTSLVIRPDLGLDLQIQEAPPLTEALSYDSFEDWVLEIDGRSFPFEVPEGLVDLAPRATWPDHGLSWADGQRVSVQLREATYVTGRSFTDSEDKEDKQYVYRVWAYNDRGRSYYSFRGDWAFNGGDPGGNPGPPPLPPVQQSAPQGGGAADPPLANTPATGASTITGTARVGETLTADTAGIEDADGLTSVTFRYQWIAGGSDINGATGPSHTLTSSQQGRTIQVRVAFTDDAGNAELLTSEATEAVAAAAPAPLTARFLVAPSSHDGDYSFTFELRFSEEVEVSYLTLRDHAFTETEGDVTSARRLTQGSNSGWTITVTPDSAADVTIVLPPTTDCGAQGAICTGGGKKLSGRVELTVNGPEEQGQERQNNPATGAPAISGTPQVGETLTASTSGIADQDGLTNVSYRYQWIAGGSDIGGATGSTYTLTSSEQGQTVQVRVAFTDDANSAETLTSAATEAVAAKPTPLTAGFSNVPSSHDGQTAFSFELRFSEEFGLSYLTLRDHAFTVTGGAVNRAQRMTQGSNIGWTVTMTPAPGADVTVVLPVTTDCAVQGAICTGDGRQLSNRLEFTVSGPDG